MTSSGIAPACSAAARMNSLMLEPVWRGDSAMFVSFSPGTKPRPPTIARTAPVLVSSDTIGGVEALLGVGEHVAGVLGQGLQVGVERRVDAQAAAVRARCSAPRSVSPSTSLRLSR